MRWAVFSDADGIVRVNKQHGNFHQGSEPQAGTHVIAEIEKSGAEAAERRKRYAIRNRTHGVLSHAEVDVTARVFFREEIARPLEDQIGLVGFRQVSRATHKPRDI